MHGEVGVGEQREELREKNSTLETVPGPKWVCTPLSPGTALLESSSTIPGAGQVWQDS